MEREEPWIVYNCLFFFSGEKRDIPSPSAGVSSSFFPLFIVLVSFMHSWHLQASNANASPFALLVIFLFFSYPVSGPTFASISSSVSSFWLFFFLSLFFFLGHWSCIQTPIHHIREKNSLDFRRAFPCSYAWPLFFCQISLLSLV